MPYTKEQLESLNREIEEIHKKASAWHGNRGLVLYLVVAGAIVTLGALFFGSDDLGPAGIGLVGCLTAGGIIHYFDREKQSKKDFEEEMRLREIYKTQSDRTLT